jgi:hypothetical protein
MPAHNYSAAFEIEHHQLFSMAGISANPQEAMPSWYARTIIEHRGFVAAERLFFMVARVRPVRG